jgi:RNA polymerase sigma factor (sigma-70 family)
MNDQEILQHLENDRYNRAVKGLYANLYTVKQFVVSNGGNREDAEDIFQEALVVLYKKVKAGGFILSSSLKTYLTGVSRNLWYMELRRRGKEVVMPEPLERIEELPVEYEQQFKQAEMAFNLLGEKCRQLLILFYFKKKSMYDICHVMGFSNERVAKNQKYRCLEKAKDNYITLNT